MVCLITWLKLSDIRCLVFRWSVYKLVGIWNLTIQNPEIFDIPTFWRSDFKWSSFQMVGALAMAITLVPTIKNPDHSKSGHFCLDFNWLLTKKRPFARISNGWASRFQIPFKILTWLVRISDPQCTQWIKRVILVSQHWIMKIGPGFKCQLN